jgi:hypothetical protein
LRMGMGGRTKASNEFMSQLQKKETIFGLRVAILGPKLP